MLSGVMYVELLKYIVMLKYTAKYHKNDCSAQVRMNYQSNSLAKITFKTQNKHFSIRRFSDVHFTPRKIR